MDGYTLYKDDKMDGQNDDWMDGQKDDWMDGQKDDRIDLYQFKLIFLKRAFLRFWIKKNIEKLSKICM